MNKENLAFYVAVSKYHKFISFWQEDETGVMICFCQIKPKIKKYPFGVNSFLEGHIGVLDEAQLIKFVNAEILHNIPPGKLCEMESVRQSNLYVGERYPRIWRGWHNEVVSGFQTVSEDISLPEYKSKIGALKAASSLFSEFVEVFRYVEPHLANYETYGVRLRELLILACTEVEAVMKGVLLANNVSPLGSFYTTRDYVKLMAIFNLSEWGATIKNQTETTNEYPFIEWDQSRPTESIPWYSAYNAVKHDREGSGDKATFKNTLSAMIGLYLLNLAAWGPGAFEELELKVPFELVSYWVGGLDEVAMPHSDGSESRLRFYSV